MIKKSIVVLSVLISLSALAMQEGADSRSQAIRDDFDISKYSDDAIEEDLIRKKDGRRYLMCKAAQHALSLDNVALLMGSRKSIIDSSTHIRGEERYAQLCPDKTFTVFCNMLARLEQLLVDEDSLNSDERTAFELVRRKHLILLAEMLKHDNFAHVKKHLEKVLGYFEKTHTAWPPSEHGSDKIFSRLSSFAVVKDALDERRKHSLRLPYDKKVLLAR